MNLAFTILLWDLVVFATAATLTFILYCLAVLLDA